MINAALVVMPHRLRFAHQQSLSQPVVALSGIRRSAASVLRSQSR
jgi:hypothetical protein